MSVFDRVGGGSTALLKWRGVRWGLGSDAVAHAGRLILAAAALFAVMPHSPAQAQNEAQAASGPPFHVPIFVSTRKDECFDRGDVKSIRKLASLEAEQINRQGGIFGRPLEPVFFDNVRDTARTMTNVRSAIGGQQVIAMIGLARSVDAKATFEELNIEIANSAIPWLTDISVNSIFEKHPNVFTMRASQDEDRVPAMSRFMEALDFSRPAFVGLKDLLYSTSLGDDLGKAVKGGWAADIRLGMKDEQLDAAEVSAAIAALKDKRPDIIVLTVGGQRTVEIIKGLMAAEFMPALFVSGTLEDLPADLKSAYKNAMYQVTFDRLPDLYNNRLRALIDGETPHEWSFEGEPVPEAPGWAKGECTERPELEVPDPLTASNIRAITVGSQYADMLKLIAAAARAAGPNANLAERRERIIAELKTTYAAGRGAFKGRFQNWSFQPSSRSAVRTPFIVMMPQGLGRTQLAPVQFVRLKSGKLRRIKTLYLDIDIVRAHRVDDSAKSFYAEFLLLMHTGSGATIDNLEFTNAYLDPQTNGRQISVEVVHPGGASEAFPEAMRIYRVSGRFMFEPKLSDYPFDTQRFSIDIQPKKGDQPFIVQPPREDLRDRDIATDGWIQRAQYVSYEEDFVPVIDAFSHQPSVVPHYKASFAVVMKRETTDYFLRVVVPLAFILIVAYVSIFIPLSHFEAIVTIQVTALLSAVALYLSIPQLGSDTATLSDRIFVFDYMMVSFMIVISIMMVNRHVADRPWIRTALQYTHIVGVPLIVAVMAYYVHVQSLAER
ncbi:MAG: ABC transporter substrate-binding protein [Hyphomicrobiaceae bacterium]|nr:ABC transporter substrate-binding protein [Hyphomicrobiaceae bacterium]